jgi:two-component system, sensor histidine kinase
MTDASRTHDVILFAPRGRNAAVISQPLEQTGIHCVITPTAEAFLEQIGREAGVAVITEEALTPGFTKALIALLQQQPPWSDLPIVVITHSGDASRSTLLKLGQLEQMRNVTFIEQPVRMLTLLSTVNAALQARRRQYEVRDHLLRQHESEEAWKQANHRKDEFLAMLAHELRNPLAALSGACEIMRMPDMQEDVPWCQEIIERQVKQLTRLVDDLLDVSRISRGKITLKKEIGRAVDRATTARTGDGLSIGRRDRRG